MKTKPSKQHIVLIHGIWMTPLFLLYYYWRVKSLSYNVHLFSYTPAISSWEQSLERLDKFIKQLPHQDLHFIAHSLGGLLVCDYLQKYTPPKQGRIVLLASPIAGSSTAHHLSQYRLGRRILGSAQNILCKPHFSSNWNWEIGAIAGTVGIGISRILGNLDKPNDGAISVAETQSPWLTDHCSLDVSHSGILLSRKAAFQTLYFLEHGIFINNNP